MATVLRFRILGAALCAAALAACSVNGAPPDDEAVITERAEARYVALAELRFRDAYAFFTPSFRERYDYDTWLRARAPRARIKSGKVVQVECLSAEACNVEVESVYENPTGIKGAPKGEIARVVAERWVNIDGQWWLYQNQ